MALLFLRETMPAVHLSTRSRLTPLAFQLKARNSPTGCRRNFTSTPVGRRQDPLARTGLDLEQKKYLESALRVNQAGELAATLIYSAQTPPLLKSHPSLRNLMKHMYEQEAGHFSTFNHLMAKHRIRPTAMYPVWSTLAAGLGWATGVMGREASMACTEAVETEIGEHYNNQVKELLTWVEARQARGEAVGEELQGLLGVIRKCRDEELEHLDHAVENDAKEANPYELLTGVIRAGCRGAIWVSERV